MDAIGRKVIRSFMPDQHRDFFAQLPFVLVGTVDHAGDSWATILTGAPGFLHSPDPAVLEVAAGCAPGDPAAAGMVEGADIGMLGIELHTRRRNRVNGRMRRHGADRFSLTVEHSFGNCPKYIQLRQFRWEAGAPGAPVALAALDARARAIIEEADTFFVASHVELEGGRRQVDVSHRGGKPGFVRLGPQGRLTIPDFSGNRHFNTLGNILANGHAGLLFIDFERGDLLQMTGDAELILDSPEIQAFAGCERLWRFAPRRIVLRPGASPLRWRAHDEMLSPHLLATGAWAPRSSNS
ncbi:MAG: pyridoxamine 5'-phosphate oxidase family protein [Sphingomonas sp.]|nr:pyridoxamine 5'-phosphate oxidase family protein [Sphingomonas sp.]